VFGNRCMSIAEQMGAVLRNTSVSTNIKERLDYSCAVFDAAGQMVSQAAHIPVHLGAMPTAVRAVMALAPFAPLPAGQDRHCRHWPGGDAHRVGARARRPGRRWCRRSPRPGIPPLA